MCIGDSAWFARSPAGLPLVDETLQRALGFYRRESLLAIGFALATLALFAAARFTRAPRRRLESAAISLVPLPLWPDGPSPVRSPPAPPPLTPPVAGGLRAGIWTEVVQVVWMLGGALMTIGYVAINTASTPADWYELVVTKHSTKQLEWFSFDPFTRSTIFTVALNMFVWHICTHIGNQMTVQRYFSAGSLAAARKSFVVGLSLIHI